MAVETRKTRKTYESDVGPSSTDAYCQHNSLWRFWPQYEGFEEDDHDFKEWRAMGTAPTLGVWAVHDDLA